MKTSLGHRTTSPLRVAELLALLALPLAVSAQMAGPVQESDWRRANDAVGALQRGHADVLQWEQANPGASPETPGSRTGMALPTAEAAVRSAWQFHVIVETRASPAARDWNVRERA